MSDLPEWVRTVLRCPACRGELDEVGEGALGCKGCGRTYPVTDGVPVLLVDEAIETVKDGS